MNKIVEYNQIIQGDSLTVLKTLPDESVNCCVTSPPYWGLRDYGIEPIIWDGVEGCEHDFSIETKAGDIRFRGVNSIVGSERNPEVWKGNGKGNFCSKCGAWLGSLGLEPTFELYIKHLCDIFNEVKRVLRKDGTCWVNIGDSYGGFQGKNAGWPDSKTRAKVPQQLKPKQYAKSLLDIPYRFSIEMTNRGWIKRNTIIWHKPNCMPSSAKDRFTVDFEYIYFFVKSKKYWFEQVFEEYKYPLDRWGGIYTDGNVPNSKYLKEDIDPAQITKRPRSFRPNNQGRNKRAVWTISTKPFSEAYFATFPEDLIEPMIQAGCPRYVCKKCGKAREKIYEPSEEYMGYVNYAPYRNIIDLKIFGEYIRKAREKMKLTRNQVEDLLGTNTALAWWEGRKYYGEMQYQLPNPDNYKKLKDILNLDDKYDKAILTIFKKTKEGWVNRSTNSNPLVEGNRKGGKSLTASYKTIGLTDCHCNAGFEGGVVLDPFGGAMTTCVVAKKQGKRYIAIELKSEYIKMGQKRLDKTPYPMLLFE